MNHNTINYRNNHVIYNKILSKRELKGIAQNYPLWKLNLTTEEYEGIKSTLYDNRYRLDNYSMEAAIYYAEWWKREYEGQKPSKKVIARNIGLNDEEASLLFDAARDALKQRNYAFIRTPKRTEYFRTLLNQGGLPVNSIMNNVGYQNNFSRFLQGLIKHFSEIYINWDDYDISKIEDLNCATYLSESFKNDNIYYVSFQIVRAIIEGKDDHLPYDINEDSLSKLTKTLKDYNKNLKDYSNLKLPKISWKLIKSDENYANLYINVDLVKDISTNLIPKLNSKTCYTFDVFISGEFVGKYIRKEIDSQSDNSRIVYSRLSPNKSKNILWKGEQVVETKIICDNGDRLFITIPGSYPPNFGVPQLFQQLERNTYINADISNQQNNLAIFDSQWRTDNSLAIRIRDKEYYYEKFSTDIYINNIETHEKYYLTSNFSLYTVEFIGEYLEWIEKSNYKLIRKIPAITVYQKDDGKRITNSRIQYRFRKNRNKWYDTTELTELPIGLVDIRVIFPDGQQALETFYCIGDLTIDSCNEQLHSTELVYNCTSEINLKMEPLQGANVTKINSNKWKISYDANSMVCPNSCTFKLISEDTYDLKLEVPVLFDGVVITDVDGNIVPNDTTISMANLTHYNVICHGKNRQVIISHFSVDSDQTKKEFKSNLIEGYVPLSEYKDLIDRIFNLYGTNSLDRSCSVRLTFGEKNVKIRKMTFEVYILQDTIFVGKTTDLKVSYDEDLYALPIGENVPIEDLKPIKLELKSENSFSFPIDFQNQEVIIFSGVEAKEKVIPKYIDRRGNDSFVEHEYLSVDSWIDVLTEENVNGIHWKKVCKAYEIFVEHNLPFLIYNGFRAISRDKCLIIKFLIAMWSGSLEEILYQDIERFEQEMAIAIHWIPVSLWSEIINMYIQTIPGNEILSIKILSCCCEFLRCLFGITLSPQISNEYINIINGSFYKKRSMFTNGEINEYKSKIHGFSDDNSDLPIANFVLQEHYYYRQRINKTSKVMLEAPMCAAENAANISNCFDLFFKENKNEARILNFYKKYFKELYSHIFIETLKIIKK